MGRAQMTVAEVMERSAADRDFFFERIVKIRLKKGGRLVPLHMRPAQRRLMEAIDARRAQGVRPQVVILKARQIGFSTVTAAEFFRRAFVGKHRQTLISAHKAEPAEILFDRIRLMHAQLPKALRPKNKADTKRAMHFEEQDCRLEVAIANEARAMTAQDLHISELAFYENADRFMTSVLETCPDDPDATVIVESTPNGIGNTFHDLWVRASRPGTKSEWIPFFVPWFDEPTYVKRPTFTMEELFARGDDAALRAQEIVTVHNVSLEQIAWWLDHLENTHFGDLDTMEQEMATDPRSCFLASGRSVFDRKGLRYYMEMSGIDPDAQSAPDEHAIDARDCELEDNPVDKTKPLVKPLRHGHWRIFREPNPRHTYIIGGDISAGDPGSDACVLAFLNRHTLDLDAVWYGRTPPDLLAVHAMRGGFWYGIAQAAGEANNQGILFNKVLELQEYPNIFRRRVTEQTIAAKFTLKPGFWTSGENRDLLFGVLRRYVRDKSGRIEDPRLVWELAQLQFEEGTDRIDHPDGGSSDFALAFAIALAVHMGSFQAILAPLSLEQQSAAAGIADSIARSKSMGLSTASAMAELDIFGVSLEEVDAAYETLERVSAHRRKIGADGAV